MKFSVWCILPALFALAGVWGSEPLMITEGEPQLFVDDALIESGEGLVRTLHQPVKDNGGEFPIIELDAIFGSPGTQEANGTILYDPKLEKYVMFALAHAPSIPRDDPDSWRRTHLLRYTSEDGLNWIPGDNGERQQVLPRKREDFYLPKVDAYAHNIDLCSFYYDIKDENYPYKGWVWYKGWAAMDEDWATYLDGIYYVRSTDGKYWERGPQILRNRIHSPVQDGRRLNGPLDVTTFSHDTGSGRFLALIKFGLPQDREVDPATGNKFRSRAYKFFDRLDAPIDESEITRVDLVPPGVDTGGDTRYDEYYSSTAWRNGSHWLGTLKIWHEKGDYPYSSSGCAFFKLVASRDGLHWEKVQFANGDGYPEVFLANGKEGGNKGRNDGGYMTDFSNKPLRIADELVFYYGASSYGKNHPDGVRISGGGIFRARLRVDGFVSVDAGMLTTHPLQFKGDDLIVNSKGKVSMEVIASNGDRLGSARINGDSIRHKVRFKKQSIRQLAGGEPVQLRFVAGKGSELYSFSFE